MHGVVAAGGMATVHLGRLLGAGGFARNVAIKRLHPQFAADPEVAATFAEEARLAARVTHANVVAMLDVISADGELLLVMEYVHGESLARLLREARTTSSRVPVPIVTSVLADVLHGLHAAHEAAGEDGHPLRLVHRDVSPQNVIVGADGVARVVDFGIAKALGSAQITREGQLKGKMPYMAPEQLLRRGIDRGIDVYAAGVILWEALAGRRLFDALDEPALFSAILEKPIAPPSTLNSEVPAALDDVTMRALARDPGQRYATAREMAMAIESVVHRAPSSAVAEWVSTTAREALVTRAAQVAEMEREARATREDATPAVRAPSASVLFHDVAAPNRPTDPPPISGSRSGSAAVTSPSALNLSNDPLRRARTRRRALAGFAALAVLLVLFGAFAATRHTSEALPPEVAAAPSAPPAIDFPSAAPVPPSTSQSSPAATAPVIAASSVASPASSSAQAPRASVTTKWCKVFDPTKRIFVMKSMRVARCP